MKLKVCGITNEADAIGLAQAGTNYLGYILNYPKSPRFIVPSAAQKIISLVKRLYPTVQHVGVLVAPSPEFIQEVEALNLFDVLQIYGTIPSNVTLPVWQSEIGGVSAPQVAQVTMLHCDAGLGSGKQLTEEILTNLNPTLPLVIAGGINQTNVLQIIHQCHPTVVDVNSGVETLPGKKDIKKFYELRQLILQN